MKRFFFLFLLLFLIVNVYSAPPNAEAKKKIAQAKQLFKEYKALRSVRGKQEKAAEKLKAALKLAPRNEEYRLAEIMDSFSTWYFTADPAQKFRYMEQQGTRAESFRKDFPKSKIRVFSNCNIFPLGLWINFDSTLSREDRKKLAALSSRFCDQVLAETGSNVPAVNTEKPIADNADLMRLTEECARAQLPFYYTSLEKWLEARARNAEAVLPLLDEYVAKNSGTMYQVRREIQKSGIFGLSNYLAWPNLDRNSHKVFFAYLKKSPELIEKLKNSRIPDIRAAGASMNAALALSNAGTGREKIKKVLFEYFAALDASDPEWMNDTCFPETGVPFSNFLSFGLPYLPDRLGDARSKFLPGVLSDYRATREVGDAVIPSGASKADLIALLRKEDATALKKNAELFRKSALLIACDSALSQDLRVLPSDVKDKIFSDFNKAFKIRRSKYGDFFKAKTSLHCLGAEMCNGTLYVLLASGEKKFFIGILAPGKPPKIEDLPDFFPFTHDVINQRAFRACSNGKSVAIIGKDSIVIGDCMFRKSRSCPSFSSSMLARGAHIDGDTLYVMYSLDGIKNTPKAIAFFSMDLFGHARKTIFDSRRSKEEKKSEFEKIPNPFISAMAGIDHMILFRLDNSLYSYDTVSGTFSKRMDLGVTEENSILEFHSGVLWSSLGSNQTRLCRIDMSQWTAEVFFEQKKNAKGNALYKIPGGSHLYPIFAVQKDILYFGGFHPAVIRLKEPEKSSLLFLPDAISVFPFEDDILYFGKKELFSVREK